MKVLLCTPEENVLKDIKENRISETVCGEEINIGYIKEDRRGMICIIYNPNNKSGEARKISMPYTAAKLEVRTPYLLARSDYGEFTDIDMEDVGYYMLALEGDGN